MDTASIEERLDRLERAVEKLILAQPVPAREKVKTPKRDMQRDTQRRHGATPDIDSNRLDIRIARGFVEECLISLPYRNTGMRISRVALWQAYHKYVYHWLRREVNADRLAEDEATTYFYTNGPMTQSQFGRFIGAMRREGKMPYIGDLNRGERFYTNLSFSDTMKMIEEYGGDAGWLLPEHSTQ